MILASHIVVSGLLGTTTNNYFLAAVFGFVSHYLLDAIPHWDYLPDEFALKIKTENGFLKNKMFWQKILGIAFDALIGLTLLFVILATISKNSLSTIIVPVFISVFFGILPDALQFLHWLTKWSFLKWNSDAQHFMHYSIHKKTRQNFWPGIITQIAIMGIIILALYRF